MEQPECIGRKNLLAICGIGDRFVEKIDEAQFGDSIPNPPSSTDQFAAAEGGMGDSLGARGSL
jgi:hypothetical protein